MARVYVSRINGEWMVLYDGVRLLSHQIEELKRVAVVCECQRCTACVVNFLTSERAA